MSLNKDITYTLIAADSDGIAKAQTLSEAGELTLNGDLVSSDLQVFKTPDKTARKITLTSAGNLSPLTFSIKGKQLQADISQVETIQGPNSDTVSTDNYYTLVEEILVNGGTGSSVSAGISEDAVTVPILTARYNSEPMSVSIEIGAGDTANCTVQHSVSDVLELTKKGTYNESSVGFLDKTELSNLTSGQTLATYNHPVTALRVKLNSYSNTPSIRLRIVEETNRS